MIRSRLILSTVLCTHLAGETLADPASLPPIGPDELAFSVRNMDPSADPAEDFLRYSSGGWLDRVARPAQLPSYGIFSIMVERLTRQVAGVAEKAGREAQAAPKGSPTQLVGDFYNAFMDVEAIDDAGIEPIRSMLDEVAAAGSVGDLVRIAAEQAAAAGPALLAMIGPAPDPADNSRHAMFVVGQSFGLDRNFLEILRLNADSPPKTAYRAYIRNLLVAAGYDAPEAERIADVSLKIETALYAHFLTPAEAKIPANRYGTLSYAEAKAQVPDFDLDLYLDTIGFSRPETLYMYEPRALAGLAELLRTVPLEDLKDYYSFRLIHEFAPFLTSALREPGLDLQEALVGARNDRPRAERLYQLFIEKLGHPVSQLYVEQYYSDATKAEVLDMIERTKAVFRRRITESEWLTAPTMQEALHKIDNFYHKVGYPDEWIDFGSVDIVPDDPVANIIALGRFDMSRELEKLRHPPKHDEFNDRSTLPIAMNAAYSPMINGFEVTAAITQAPVFAASDDAPLKFCRIGAVIGHEMTHGFDFSGRHFDAVGNLRNWWTPEDNAAFLVEAQKLIDQAEAFEVLPGLHMNGLLSVGENVADVGGITLGHEALMVYLEEHPEENVEIDGLTPEQRCFIGWSQFWTMKATDPYLRAIVANDGHAPDFYRSVAALQHVDAFYDAFDIRAGDPMWLPPEKRARAW
ncbi:M13 family metallopeptidase [Paracoccus sp. MBLB3053]|uniref:M13 family metallopeptidase n=1 Tax=Paracoccus aurantius TaxID=3073814 RepID=A0ABU2I0D9_9RHOB|nr:M13 family metallopeptidase [Paracoccus sp. MBLB3053]MDS9469999.1 M13 family metallopeptidase [Paracoccus sp. MBLB3053]